MPEKISYDEKIGVIRVVSAGDISLEEWMQSLAKIKELSNRNGCRSVLVDISGQTSLPKTIELYFFGKELPANLRFALVNPAGLPQNHTFLKDVGENRGKVIMHFPSEDAAIAWLVKNPESRAV